MNYQGPKRTKRTITNKHKKPKIKQCFLCLLIRINHTSMEQPKMCVLGLAVSLEVFSLVGSLEASQGIDLVGGSQGSHWDCTLYTGLCIKPTDVCRSTRAHLCFNITMKGQIIVPD